MATKWKPLGGTEWLQQPDWLLDDPLPERPVTTPAGRGLPEFVPYTYRGTDYSEPGETTVTDARPPHRKARKAAALDDPEWDTAAPWTCRPPYWSQGDSDV